jgi:hypothetical protein
MKYKQKQNHSLWLLSLNTVSLRQILASSLASSYNLHSHITTSFEF